MSTVMQFLKRFSYAFAILCALLCASAVAAWNGPASAPPSGNVAAPLNVGSTDQVKAGGLTATKFHVAVGSANDYGMWEGGNVLKIGEWASGQGVQINSVGNVGIDVVPSATYDLDVYGTYGIRAQQFIYRSDERWKTNIQTLGDALQTVLGLRGVTFTWKPGTPQAGQEDIGFIAQEVQKVAPELVTTDDQGYEGVDYARVAPILVNAIHEQQAQLDAQQKEIDALTAQLNALAPAK